MTVSFLGLFDIQYHFMTSLLIHSFRFFFVSSIKGLQLLHHHDYFFLMNVESYRKGAPNTVKSYLDPYNRKTNKQWHKERFSLMSCDSPYLPVIQAHLVALCLPIRKESDRSHYSFGKMAKVYFFPCHRLTLLPISPGGPRGPWKTETKCSTLNLSAPLRGLWIYFCF